METDAPLGIDGAHTSHITKKQHERLLMAAALLTRAEKGMSAGVLLFSESKPPNVCYTQRIRITYNDFIN